MSEGGRLIGIILVLFLLGSFVSSNSTSELGVKVEIGEEIDIQEGEEIIQDEASESLELIEEQLEVEDTEKILEGEEDVIYIPLEEVIEEIEKNETKEEPTEVIENTGDELNETEDDLVKNESLEEVGEEFEYIDLEAIIPEIEEEVEVIRDKKIQKSLVKDGRVEIEFETFENEEVEIEKTEILRSDIEKKIVISSEIHFEEELRVYSDLPMEAAEEDIILIWENEDEEVEEIRYLDENDNGLVDRISWIVPHLSTQTYSIHIQVNNAGGSSSLSLSVVNPTNGEVNPENFEIELNYSAKELVLCNLVIGTMIDEFFYYNATNLNISSLGLGSYDWDLDCWDINNTNMTDSASGNFLVESSLSVNVNKNHYLVGDGAVISLNDGGLGSTDLKLQRPDGINITITSTSSLLTGQMNQIGSYILYATNDYFVEEITVSDSFEVGKIEADFETEVTEGEGMNILINATNVGSGISYELYVGSTLIEVGSITSSNGIRNKLWTPENEGSFEVRLDNIYINGNYRSGEIDFGDLVVDDGVDGEDPDIDLRFPGWEEEVDDDTINFRYSASDNDKLKNCSLEIFNLSKTGSGTYETGELLFPLNSRDREIAREYSLENDEDVEVKLVDFDEGEYIWEVTCYDVSENEEREWNVFEVELGTGSRSSISGSTNDDYENKDRVNALIDAINEYLENLGDFGPSEESVAKVLDSTSDANAYKKKLLQFDQDLKNNLRYMEAAKKERRLVEIYEEIDEMEEKVIKDIEVIKNYDYMKSSLDSPLEDLLGEYLEEINAGLNGKEFKSLVGYNEELQKDLEAEVSVWQIRVSYFDREEDLVLVSKNIDVSGNFKGEILEIIPEDFGEPVFLTSVSKISSKIYEFYLKDLEEDSLIYYFDEKIDLEDLEETETLLYEEGKTRVSGITGFFSFSSGFGFSWISMILTLLLVGYLGIWMFGKYRFNNMKKIPGVSKILDLIEQTNNLILENEVDASRDNYQKMKEIYRALPVKAQEHFYPELRKIRIAINKKDIINLVKEYEKAKEEFRKEDAERIYVRINQIYPKLPRKFQEKVYRRLVKKEI